MPKQTATFFWTYTALLGLLSLTVAQYEWRLLPHGFAIALLISAMKAILIAWIFMDLRQESTLIRLTATAGLLWIFIFFGLSGLSFLSARTF